MKTAIHSTVSNSGYRRYRRHTLGHGRLLLARQFYQAYCRLGRWSRSRLVQVAYLVNLSFNAYTAVQAVLV